MPVFQSAKLMIMKSTIWEVEAEKTRVEFVE